MSVCLSGRVMMDTLSSLYGHVFACYDPQCECGPIVGLMGK